MRHLLKTCAIVTAACVALPLESLAEPAATKPITHEALWMMKRVGAPVVSPDGKWVVYAVLEPSYETDKAVSDSGWCRPTDASRRAASPIPRAPEERRCLVCPTAQHCLLHQTRRRRGRADLYSQSRAGRRSAPAHQHIHGRQEPEVASGRQGDSVRVPGLSQRPGRRGQQKNRRGAQGPQIQRASL